MIKKISCTIHKEDGYVIIKSGQLIGWIWKLRDGDYKWACGTMSTPCLGYSLTMMDSISYLQEEIR